MLCLKNSIENQMKIAMINLLIKIFERFYLMNRRSFFQSVGMLIGAAALLPVVARAEGRRGGGAGAAKAAGGAQLVDPKDSQALSVNYVEVNSEIKDKTLMSARAGVQFKDQKCKGCAFYVADKETSVAGKKAAPCQMPFAAGKVVTAEGWCSSWAKKA